MTTEAVIRIFFALIMSIFFTYIAFDNQERDKRFSSKEDGGIRYRPHIGSAILPVYLIALFVYSVIKLGPETTRNYLPALCFDVFLHISIYYLVLILCLSKLRRYVSARACAQLWIIPNFLYITHQSFMAIPKPALILRIPPAVINVVLYLWITGFIAIMVWKLLAHIHFRHSILRNAYAVSDPDVLTIWHREQDAAGYKKNPSCLVISPDVRTPLSIGFFHWSVRVVLPERSYTPEELTLILRHEIVHIGRDDCSAKFFLTFCTAMCWFNPLMWIANRRCSDDLELSCDETVLLDAKAHTRRQYADLLLRTVGDDRGFTSCLSNSAKALQYRLKNVINPRKKLPGCVLIGLTFFLLVMSFGHISLSFHEGIGQEYIFQNTDLSEYSVQALYIHDADGFQYYDCTDEESLKEYLAGVRFCKLTGNYTFPDDIQNINIRFYGPEGVFHVSLTDNALKITPLHEEKIYSKKYYCTEAIDWDSLYSLTCP